MHGLNTPRKHKVPVRVWHESFFTCPRLTDNVVTRLTVENLFFRHSRLLDILLVFRMPWMVDGELIVDFLFCH